jgi:hypothetical protein
MNPILAGFTLLHVVISLVGIFAGFVVLRGMLSSKPLDGWTGLFLTATVLTSVTGFFFPVHHFMPSHAIGILSLLILSVTIYALYGRRLGGSWRWIYVVTAMMAQYLNFFVLIVQSFMKVTPLHSLAPTQTEPSFKITQLVVLVLFVLLTAAAAIRFHPSHPLPTTA